MSEWRKVKIGDFLKVRQGKYKPNDKAILNLKRLNKIDFSGQIHLSDKPTKTDMIIIHSGDLVISGINVAKGAIAIHKGQPITATIHYSSYEFDDSKIDIDFLKRFLKSPSFISALNLQVKGGIKTEIKAKTLLSIVVQLPSLSEQKLINKRFETFENELVELNSEILNQQIYLTKLRQAILQEAIEGKLTADWRVNNPVCLGDPNTNAHALLENIKAEKQRLISDGKIKKNKPLTPIKSDELPFDLPAGWVWVRFENICDICTNNVSPFDYPNYPHIAPNNIEKNTGKLLEYCTVEEDGIFSVKHRFFPNMLIYSKVRPRLRKIVKVDFEELCSADMYPLQPKINSEYLMTLMLTNFFDAEVYKLDNRSKMPKINQDQLNTIPISVPPLAEQQAIVERVDRLLNQVNALEQQVKARKNYAEQLMQSVLKEAFDGG